MQNRITVEQLYQGWQFKFREGYEQAAEKLWYQQLTDRVDSVKTAEKYPWTSGVPAMREFKGDRDWHRLSAHMYTLQNRAREASLAINKYDVDDGELISLAREFEQLGQNAALDPNYMLRDVINAGCNTIGPDGVAFFSQNHPGPKGTTWSNLDPAGGQTPWMLVDLNQVIKPFIFQMRQEPMLQGFMDPRDPNVRDKKEYWFTIDGRWAVGYGAPHTVFVSFQPFTRANLYAAMEAMNAYQNMSGIYREVEATHVCFPPSLRATVDTIIGQKTIIDTTASTKSGDNTLFESVQRFKIRGMNIAA